MRVAVLCGGLLLSGCASTPSELHYMHVSGTIDQRALALATAQCRAEAIQRVGSLRGAEGAYAQMDFGRQLSDMGDTIAANRGRAEARSAVMDGCMAKLGFVRS